MQQIVNIDDSSEESDNNPYDEDSFQEVQVEIEESENLQTECIEEMIP